MPLTQLQEQTARSLARMRPERAKTLFEDLDWAVWTSCVRQMAKTLGLGTDEQLKEFRRLTRERHETH